MTVEQALQYAVGRHQAGSLAEAEAVYRQIIALQPDQPDPYYLLAEISYRAGQLSVARELVERAIILQPGPAQYHNLLGAVLTGLKCYEAAASSLRRAIALDPLQTLAYCNLGNLLRELGRFDEAVDAYQRALSLDSGSFAVRHGLGLVFLSAERMGEAIESFRMAARLDPRSAEAHYNLGTSLSKVEDYRAAEEALRAAIQLQPRLVPAHRLLPAVLGRLGRLQDAIDALRDAARLVPNDPVVWNDLGVALTDLLPESATEARYDEAIACCQRALALKPDLFEAHNNLGNALSSRKRWDEAITSYQRALALNQGYPQTQINLGAAYFELGRYDESIACCRRALALDPDSMEAHQNLGSAFVKKWDWDEAIASLQRAVTLKPDYADAYSHLGIAYCAKGDLDQALHFHRRAIACGPNAANVHWNYATFLLLIGRYEEGWREFEWRFGHITRLPDVSTPQWDGRRLEGETLLLHAEQGFGDTLQFVRYVRLVRARSGAGRVILGCPPKLVRLLTRHRGWNAEIVTLADWSEAELPPYDWRLPLMSLPLALELYEPLSISAPYLTADPALQAVWRERLGASSGLRVGVVWAGNPEHKEDLRRSIELDQFLPVLGVPGCRFYSLLVDHPRRDSKALAESGVIDLTDAMTDFEDTAAFIAELDLVIAVDTAAAHLAGALGRPVWLLVAFTPDWRWGLQREDTPWYPNMRIFRQSADGDWTPVAHRVADALREMTNDKLVPGVDARV